MTGDRMEANGPPTNGLVKLNHHRMWIGQNGDRVSVEEELKNSGVNKHHSESEQAHRIKHIQQEQPGGPLVLWDRFLPLGSLKVLLVENDDSTQQVIKALLRNCGYEVMAVANGLQAWKILEDITNHIDLVLAELSMPYLSGIGLLTKIKNHKTCKNIPVIVMSANDSMGIVFKCLSKGAADFLQKPIRKNELKNLWQHVWRKCQIVINQDVNFLVLQSFNKAAKNGNGKESLDSKSSCSGSESGIWTQKSKKSKSSDKQDNYNDSSDGDDTGSVGLNARGGKDDISSTQSSWSKRSIEGGSPQIFSPCNELADAPGSTSGQEIHSRPSLLRVSTASTIKHLKPDDVLAMGKDLEVGFLNHPDLELQVRKEEVFGSTLDTENDKFLVLDSVEDSNNSKKEKVELRNGNSFPIDATTDIPIHLMVSVGHNFSSDLSKLTNFKHSAYDPKEMPCLEISLKRLRDTSETGIDTLQQNILRQTDISAFSRYNANATSVNVGSCSPVNNSSEAAKTGSKPYQGSNGSSPNNDPGSTTTNAFAKKEGDIDKTMLDHPSSTSLPVQLGNTFGQPILLENPDTTLAQGKTLDHQNEVQNHHHHHHHHHHHYHHHHPHNLPQQQPLNHSDLSFVNLTAVAANGGPPETLGQELEGNANNYGSAPGSNGNNESSGPRGSDNKAIVKCGPGDGSGKGSRREIDQNRLAQREASLNKFRQKRKERCFEKKVRYHGRKRLAEQRPRVRGQFVRQITEEDRSRAEKEDRES